MESYLAVGEPMTPERIAELTALCEKAKEMAPTYTEILLQPSIKDQTCTRVEECAYYDLSATRQLHNEIAASVGSALPELLAELSRLTRERDEAFNAGVEAAANVSIGSVARLPRITNTHKIAEICQFDPLQGWITKEDVIRYGSEITDGIRALKKPATDEAAGKSGE